MREGGKEGGRERAGERREEDYRLSRKCVQFSEQENPEYPQARVSTFIIELVHQSSNAN